MIDYRKYVFLIMYSVLVRALEIDNAMGCYKGISRAQIKPIEGYINPKQCIRLCSSNYYRYAFNNKEATCICSNFLSNLMDAKPCKEYCVDCDYADELYDVFTTSIMMNGPPTNFTIEHITETRVHFSWSKPEVFIDIYSYKIKAIILHTYSSTKLQTPEWMYSNNTFRAELINLHPGTHYNFTIQAISNNIDGAIAYRDVETIIGTPDEVPDEPEIIEQDSTTMKVKIKPVTNNNGPVSSYLVVVIDGDSVQAVQTENLRPYRQANTEGYSYYITAEIQPEKLNQVFTIGDGRDYSKYYNAPLDKDKTYYVMIGVVSRVRNNERIVYGHTTAMQNDVIVAQMPNRPVEESSALIVFLSISIVIISMLLLVGLVAFYYLRNYIHHQHRQRLNDNQELTIQGPMIDVENNGYITDEDAGHSTNHYDNLTKQVWTIPKDLLSIEHTILLGIGKFGRVHCGSVIRDSVLTPVGVYSIADRKLRPDEKRGMLRDLDVLVKLKSHPKVLELIGTCETLDTICIVLEHASLNLKELLVNSRVLQQDKFSSLSEKHGIELGIDIAKGMEYLHSKKILHKQLCPLHVAIIKGTTAKISGFGLARYYKSDVMPDFIRYTAKEVLRGQQHVSKSDVWSFACVLWEICALGGTPYGNISSDDISEKVIRGSRLAQLPYVNDSLYQIMLNCWQLDLDERPTFSELIYAFEDIIHEQCLSFNMYHGFEYEPYVIELEMTKKSVY